jgi:diguanylate cyclase
MSAPASAHPPAGHLKRRVLMAILALSWLSSGAAWALMEARGLCAACMALRLYSPTYGASIDLQPLYLWIPVIHVFVFTLAGHRSSLKLSLAILALFVAISLPYLVEDVQQPYGNFTIQLHVVSAVLVAALYFFSSYQQRFQIAQLTADQLARLANTDELTQLANRRRVAEAIESELLRFTRYGHSFSIILIDVDHFKAVNDRFGHSGGDKTLVALAARITDVLRHVDTLGRWGGEEFVVVLPETPFGETLHKATALCGHVAARPLVGDHAVTISCGVTSVAAGDTADTLLQRADSALYAAKRHGRNRAEGVP